MLTKKMAIILSIIGIVFIGVFLLKEKSIQSKPEGTFRIGILQTASHPALDLAREGFIEQMKAHSPRGVQFVVQNAQGMVAQARSIAQNFHADRSIDGVYAIASPAAQAMANVDVKKPIFIAAVTDPRALGLIHPGTNVCGTVDMIDVHAEVAMLKALLPEAKTVALLFNPGEVNSVVIAQKMRHELEAVGLEPLEVGVFSESEIPSAVSLACRKADVILTPTDNMVASTIQTIAKMTRKAKVPLIVSDNLLVKQGALAARGIDYKESGKQTADIALKVLVGKVKPEAIPLLGPSDSRIFVNPKALAELGIEIPESIKEDVVFVNDAL